MIKKVDKIQRQETTPARTSAGEAPLTKCPLQTSPQSPRRLNPQTRRPTPLLPHKAAVEQVYSLGQR